MMLKNTRSHPGYQVKKWWLRYIREIDMEDSFLIRLPWYDTLLVIWLESFWHFIVEHNQLLKRDSFFIRFYGEVGFILHWIRRNTKICPLGVYGLSIIILLWIIVNHITFEIISDGEIDRTSIYGFLQNELCAKRWNYFCTVHQHYG